MKRTYLLLCTVLIAFCNGYSQYSTAGFDSVVLQPLDGDTLHIPLTKKQKREELMRNTYEFDGVGYRDYSVRYQKGILQFITNTPSWPALQLQKQKREIAYAEKFAAGGDIGRGVLKFFLPNFVSVASEKEIAWRYNAILQSGHEQLTFHCFIKGETVKEVSTEDNEGRTILQTETTSYIQYGRGAAGYVLQGTDTVSEWYASIDPKKDSSMSAVAISVLSTRPDKQKFKVLQVYTQAVYGVKGAWNNEPFTILFNDMDNKAWIFARDSLAAVFQYPGKPVRRAESALNIPEDQEPFVSYLLVSPSITSEVQKKNLLQQIALSGWLVDVMARPETDRLF